MKKLKIYVDTSVIGGCFDKEFATESNALIEMAINGEAVLLISDLLLLELEKAPAHIASLIEDLPEECTEFFDTEGEALELQRKYLKAKVVGAGSADDALHVANATVKRADMIVSWNFKHIVHYDKIRGFNSINFSEGYNMIAIYSPKEVV
jgi:predicted nucleic acid-binding protein